MRPKDLNALAAFVVVSSERSFIRAAAKLGISQSALSHAIKGLEENLGLRLLTRTTRSVSVTEAGERLLKHLVPAFDEIDAGLIQVASFRDQPSGQLRITTVRQGFDTVLQPVLTRFFEKFPEVKIEVSIDDAVTDIVLDRFDAGLRLGHHVAKDMIALPVGPRVRVAVVGSPGYFDRFGFPENPTELTGHRCINYRLSSAGTLYKWHFEKDRESFDVSVEGNLTFNDGAAIVDSAIGGHGIAYVFESQVRQHLHDGRLKRILEDWCPEIPGYHIYYPHRRHPSPAFSALVGEIRARSTQP